MRFVVSSTPVTDTTSVPSSLRHIDTLSDEAGVDHQFRFEREGNDWTINGVKFSDVRNRVLARVPVGTVEKWELLNVGPQELLHPVHLHLVDFRIIGREGGQSRDPESSENSGSSTGSKKHKTLEALKGHTDDKDTKSTSRDLSVQPYESSGLKDVVWVGPGERVTVEAHYGPWIGAYMFHCHNLVHEDHEMMAVFNVTELSELGYDNMELADPMDPRWLARPVREEAFEEDAIRRTVQEMAMLSAYTNPQKRGIGPGTTDQAA
jgi:FtsP/CotA-like multicopper oxidase with cupredoxin domain